MALPSMSEALGQLSPNGLIALAAGAVIALAVMMILLARRGGRGKARAAQNRPSAPAGAEAGAEAVSGGSKARSAPTQAAASSGDGGAGQDEDGLAGWFEIVGEDVRLEVRRGVIGIGRHEENDIRLQDRTVHRHHAVLHSAPGGGLVITDLSGATGNGVLVDDERVAQAVLRGGETVSLGAMRLRLHLAANGEHGSDEAEEREAAAPPKGADRPGRAGAQ